MFKKLILTAAFNMAVSPASAMGISAKEWMNNCFGADVPACESYFDGWYLGTA